MKEYLSNVAWEYRGWCLALLAVVSTGFLMALSPLAQAAEPLVPPGFRLQASNGYTLSVIAYEDPGAKGDVVYLTMGSRHAAVFYIAPAAVDSTSIEADLGVLGRIDVDFVSSGRPHAERSDCDGKSLLVESGRYEGSIDLEGEEGYSQVHASSAQANAKMVLNLVCSEGSKSEGIGGHSPGARLTATHRGARRFEFTAMKNSPTRPARFVASVFERRGRLLTWRGVEAMGAPGSFDFDVSAGTANVSPPDPFSGQASYYRPQGKGPGWHGDLGVDLPGRANVRLTGSGTRANLIRAVLNPGQVFRLP